MTEKNTPMDSAAEAAWENIETGNGGPFGAAVVRDGEIISVAANSVLADHDPTAHAEINAIRKAARIFGSHDLSDCILYATGYPCPMCLSAIIWANISKVYYACNVEEAASIGFRDDAIYDFIRGNNSIELDIEHLPTESCNGIYDAYADESETIY